MTTGFSLELKGLPLDIRRIPKNPSFLNKLQKIFGDYLSRGEGKL